MNRNPVLIIVGAIAGIVTPLINLLVAFGTHLDITQVGAINAGVAAVLAAVAIVVTRAQVDSPETVEARLLEAIELGHAKALEDLARGPGPEPAAGDTAAVYPPQPQPPARRPRRARG